MVLDAHTRGDHALYFLASCLPALGLTLLTIGGYLYFSALQLREAEINEERTLITTVAPTLYARLVANESEATIAASTAATDNLAADITSLLEELATASSGAIWLLDNAGNWLYRSQDSPASAALAASNPALWNTLRSNLVGEVANQDGHYNGIRLCGGIDCSGLAAIDTPATGGDEWLLVSFLPASALSPVLLLRSHSAQWLAIASLMGLAGLIATAVAALPATTLRRVRRRERHSLRYHALQEAFFENNPEIMFVKNLDGSYVSANTMCRQLAEFEGGNEEMSGKNRSEFFPDQIATTLQQQDEQVVENREPMEFFTKWKRQGVVHHYKTLRFPIFDEAGQITALGGIANDITDQARARQALQDNEQLVRTFLESAPEGVVICDPAGSITLVNRQAELIFGFERNSMLNNSLFELIPSLKEGDLVEAIENAKLISEEVFREAKEARGVHKKNRTFPLELLLAPVSTNHGSLIICLLRDISDKLLMETQLRQSQKMEAIGKLTGGMAHDFNNLLGVIIGNIDLAMRQIEDDTPGKTRLVTARLAAERGADLTKRMLAVARRQPLQPKAVSINKVIKGLWEMLPQTLGPDIEMHHNLYPELPSVIVDESGLESIMLNLAINARDAMPEGGRFTITTAVCTRAALIEAIPTLHPRFDTFAYVSVEDTGAGMSQETLDRAFEPFYSTKEKSKGSGLGLAMIYGFVKQSKGYIFLNSELGSGTLIEIYLPINEPTEFDTTHSVNPPDVTNIDRDDTTILVVDDEPDLLELATVFLEDMGYAVLSAGGGQEALDVLSDNPDIKLLMTDVVMPGGMSGIALSKAALKLNPDLYIVYVSGYPTDIIEDNSGDPLSAPLINKPYTRASLQAGITEAMVSSAKSPYPYLDD